MSAPFIAAQVTLMSACDVVRDREYGDHIILSLSLNKNRLLSL